MVEWNLAYSRLWSTDGITIARVYTVLQEGDFLPPDVPGDPLYENPDPDALLGPAITVEITGPGAVRVHAWRSNQPENDNPWWSTDTNYPNGLTEANSGEFVETGGPVKFVKSVRVRLSSF